ncbi:Sec-independent protein translocase protein TatB [Chromatium okenii]|jgi:sec-independent protein translocase protein TatB|uniref:Sec-independent protein translocase protein TatB n=1 Tax=Chromatium okenii TaxID=61644 RepID=A0A2S7XPN1_9GAMM|nr:Sec-independent protein translocase protein TatB [Chromatium okenii]MBV5309349.1 twin-arginine translocase subunit TatB [Chromatium okenii]PQJ95685.1 twin-arginine translocase subunit TatB [Chromatium okenii]
MFDVGFSELVLVAIVALLVVGPERLPKVARVAGMWLGRARRTLGAVKQEIDREMKASELADILKQQALSQSVESIIEMSTQTSAAPVTSTSAIPIPADSATTAPTSVPTDPTTHRD